MSDVINKKTLRIKRSVHTPSYPSREWIVNPSLPECDRLYYKIKDDKISEMTQAEKDIKDADIAIISKTAQKENLIVQKMNEISRADAIQALKDDGVLDDKGELKE